MNAAAAAPADVVESSLDREERLQRETETHRTLTYGRQIYSELDGEYPFRLRQVIEERTFNRNRDAGYLIPDRSNQAYVRSEIENPRSAACLGENVQTEIMSADLFQPLPRSALQTAPRGWADMKIECEYARRFFRAFDFLNQAFFNPQLGTPHTLEGSNSFQYLAESSMREGEHVPMPKVRIEVEVIVRHYDATWEDGNLFADANILGLRIRRSFMDRRARTSYYLLLKLWQNAFASGILTRDSLLKRRLMLHNLTRDDFRTKMFAMYQDERCRSDRQNLSVFAQKIDHRVELDRLDRERDFQASLEAATQRAGNDNDAIQAARADVMREYANRTQKEGPGRHWKKPDKQFMRNIAEEIDHVRASSIVSSQSRDRRGARPQKHSASIADLLRSRGGSVVGSSDVLGNENAPEHFQHPDKLSEDPTLFHKETIFTMAKMVEEILSIFDPELCEQLQNPEFRSAIGMEDYNIDDPSCPVNPAKVLSFNNSKVFFTRFCGQDPIINSPQFDYSNYVDPSSGFRIYPFPRLVFTYAPESFSPQNLRQQLFPFYGKLNTLERKLVQIEIKDREDEKRRQEQVELSRQQQQQEGDDENGRFRNLDAPPTDHDPAWLQAHRQLKKQSQPAAEDVIDLADAMPIHMRRAVASGDRSGMADPHEVTRRELGATRIESSFEVTRRTLDSVWHRVRAACILHPDQAKELMMTMRSEAMRQYLSFFSSTRSDLPKEFKAMAGYFKNPDNQRDTQTAFFHFNAIWTGGKSHMSVFASHMATLLAAVVASGLVHSGFSILMLMLLYVSHDAFDSMMNRTPLHIILAGDTMSGKSMILQFLRECTVRGIFQAANVTSKQARITLEVQDDLLVVIDEAVSIIVGDQMHFNSAQQDSINIIKSILTERTCARVTYYNHPDHSLPMQLAYEVSARLTYVMCADHLPCFGSNDSNTNRFRITYLRAPHRADKDPVDLITAMNAGGDSMRRYGRWIFDCFKTISAVCYRIWHGGNLHCIPYPDLSYFIIALNRGIRAINDYGIIDLVNNGRAIGRGTRVALNATVNRAAFNLCFGEQSPFLDRDSQGYFGKVRDFKESDIDKVQKDLFCTADITVHSLDQLWFDLFDPHTELLLQAAGRTLGGFNPVVYASAYDEAKKKGWIKMPDMCDMLVKRGLRYPEDAPDYYRENQELLNELIAKRWRGNTPKDVMNAFFVNFRVCLPSMMSMEQRNMQVWTKRIEMVNQLNQEGKEVPSLAQIDIELGQESAEKQFGDEIRQQLWRDAQNSNITLMSMASQMAGAKRVTKRELGARMQQILTSQDGAAVLNASSELSVPKGMLDPMFIQIPGDFDMLVKSSNRVLSDFFKESPVLSKDLLMRLSHRMIKVPKLKPMYDQFSPIEFCFTGSETAEGTNAIEWVSVPIIQEERVDDPRLIAMIRGGDNVRTSSKDAHFYRVLISSHYLLLCKEAVRAEFLAAAENRYSRTERTVLSTVGRYAQNTYHSHLIRPNPNVRLVITKRDHMQQVLVDQLYSHLYSTTDSTQDEVAGAIGAAMANNLAALDDSGGDDTELLTEETRTLLKTYLDPKAVDALNRSSSSFAARQPGPHRLATPAAGWNKCYDDLDGYGYDPVQVLFERFMHSEFLLVKGRDYNPETEISYPGTRELVTQGFFKSYRQFDTMRSRIDQLQYPETVLEQFDTVMRIQRSVNANIEARSGTVIVPEAPAVQSYLGATNKSCRLIADDRKRINDSCQDILEKYKKMLKDCRMLVFHSMAQETVFAKEQQQKGIFKPLEQLGAVRIDKNVLPPALDRTPPSSIPASEDSNSSVIFEKKRKSPAAAASEQQQVPKKPLFKPTVVSKAVGTIRID